MLITSAILENFLLILFPCVVVHLLIAVSTQDGRVRAKNGTLKLNETSSQHLELTTVKIAEVDMNKTHILKAITAKHFTTTTPMTRIVNLIPPANHSAQIHRRKKEHAA
jgi:hypothetical protein